MKKIIFSTLCTVTLALGALTYSAQACDCDSAGEASCSADKAGSCKSKECDCAKSDHKCEGKDCPHHKKHKAKAQKTEKAKAE